MAEAPARRFRTSEGEHLGERVVVLADDELETQVILVPTFGFPCIAFRVNTNRGEWSVLAEPPDAETFQTRLGRFGLPLMFPWPNRIRDGHFTFQGKTYNLPLAPNGQHAIHGLTRQRAWTLEEHGTDDRGAFCRASVQVGGTPDDVWPFPSRLTATYRLHGTVLTLHVEAENIGTGAMPMGFGIHPWFPLPLAPEGSRQNTEVSLPADRFWRLDETTCTTGETTPVSERFDLRQPTVIGDLFIDDVFTGLTLDDGWCTAEVRDVAGGRSIAVRSDAAFREHVVFAPLIADVVCLEPYTCATDAFNLNERGIDAGTIVLEPGQRWRGTIAIEARP
jgi:aldose 1-epimerase